MSKTQIPVPLQQQILLQSGLALLSLIAGLGISWACKDLGSGVPLIIAAVLLGCTAVRLYWIALNGRYIVLRGTILYVERTFLRRRPKALLLEVEGSALRIVLRNRLRRLSEGSVVDLYISDTTPLYVWGGVRQISSYLAIISV